MFQRFNVTAVSTADFPTVNVLCRRRWRCWSVHRLDGFVVLRRVTLSLCSVFAVALCESYWNVSQRLRSVSQLTMSISGWNDIILSVLSHSWWLLNLAEMISFFLLCFTADDDYIWLKLFYSLCSVSQLMMTTSDWNDFNLFCLTAYDDYIWLKCFQSVLSHNWWWLHLTEMISIYYVSQLMITTSDWNDFNLFCLTADDNYIWLKWLNLFCLTADDDYIWLKCFQYVLSHSWW
jgi:hypothetical protein